MMELKKVDAESARARIRGYNEKYFMNAEDIDAITGAYTLGDMLICDVPHDPSGYYVFGCRRQDADALAELIKPGGSLTVYSDGDIAPDAPRFSDSLAVMTIMGTVMKIIYLLKEGGGAPYDPDVEQLTGADAAEAWEFVDSSQAEEDSGSHEWSVMEGGRVQLRSLGMDDCDIFCIRHEGKIVGMRCVQFNGRFPNTATSSNIYISRRHRGRGFGKRLLRATLTRDGYSYQYSCNAGNLASLNTALSVGYRISGYMYLVVKEGAEHNETRKG